MWERNFKDRTGEKKSLQERSMKERVEEEWVLLSYTYIFFSQWLYSESWKEALLGPLNADTSFHTLIYIMAGDSSSNSKTLTEEHCLEKSGWSSEMVFCLWGWWSRNIFDFQGRGLSFVGWESRQHPWKWMGFSKTTHPYFLYEKLM